MDPVFSLPLISLAACCVLMTITFFIGKAINNFSIVDMAWSFNFLVIAGIIWLMTDGFEPRKAIICGLLSLWALRLGIYLGARIFSHINREEGRYIQLRKDWAANLNTKMFGFYQMQAGSNVFLAIPHFITAQNTYSHLYPLEYIGAAIWLLGIAGEGIADHQLSRFKKDPANKDRVCDTGLWYYSRHPNYFFQLTLWVGIILFSINTPWGWLSLAGGLSIAYLLFRVTGIPMTEEQALRSKGAAYKRYQQTTSMIVLWKKLKEAR